MAELRGGSLLSGCRGEASGAGRGQGPAQLSVGNRHLVLGITCRHYRQTMWNIDLAIDIDRYGWDVEDKMDEDDDLDDEGDAYES